MGSRSSRTATVNNATYDIAAYRARHRDTPPVLIQTIATYDDQLRRVIDACHALDMLPHVIIGIIVSYCRVSGHVVMALGGRSHTSTMSHAYVYGSVGDGPPPGSVPSSWCIMNGTHAQVNTISATHVYESCGYIYNVSNVDATQLQVTMYYTDSLRPSSPSSSSSHSTTMSYNARALPTPPSSFLPLITHGTDYVFAALGGALHVFGSPSRPSHGGVAATGTAYHIQYDPHSTRWSSCSVAPAINHTMSPILVVAVEDHDKVHSPITGDTGGFDLQSIGMASTGGHYHGYIYGICAIYDGSNPCMMRYDPLLGTLWSHQGTIAPCHIPSTSRMIYRRHAHDIIILATVDSTTKYPTILRFALNTNTWHSITHEKVPRFLRLSGTAIVYIPTSGAIMVAGGGDQRDQPDTFSDAVYILDDHHMKRDRVIWTRVSTLPSAQWGMAMIVV